MWYAFATNSDGKHIPYATSPDLVTWTVRERDALPKVGGWSNGQNVWAPDVLQIVRENIL
jgi:beta-xylosidase